MFPVRAGQSQVLTAVLLAGIIVAGITAAFLWGIPLLQKNQDVNEARKTLDSLRTVAQSVTSVGQEGGSRQETVPLGNGIIDVNTENDTITYIATTRGAYVSTRNWTPLNEDDMQGVPDTIFADGHGVRGIDRPGVLVGQATPADNKFTTVYRIVFRPLKDPNGDQTHQIDLVQNGNLRSSSGQAQLIFQRGQTQSRPGAGVDGSTLQLTEILIRVS